MPRPDVTELLSRAVSLHQQGDLAQAEPLYRQVLAAEPGCADAWHYLGLLAQQTGRLNAAQAMLRQAISLNPGHVDAHINLGNVLQGLNELGLAVAAYREALRLAPEHPYIPHNLGNVLLALGQLDEAARCYRQALQLEPRNAMAHYQLGNILRDQGRFAEAGNCYRAALTHQPKLASAHNNLGVLQAKQGLLTEAVLSYREALRHNPQHADALINLGDALKGQREFAQLLDCYRQATRIHPEQVAFHSRLGSLLSDLGQLHEAIECFRHAVRLAPQDAGAHYNLATALGYHGLHDEAVASFRAALELSPNNACFHNSLGMALKNQGRLEEALACVEQARRLEPREPMWHSNLLICRLYRPGYSSEQILEDQRRWYEEHAQTLAPRSRVLPTTNHETAACASAMSPPTSACTSMAATSLPLFRTHDRRRFELTLYSNRVIEDARTAQIRKLADRWRPIADWSDERVAAKVKEDRIDILVDLAAHTAGNRLLVFARKPAPVQVTWLGLTGGTTGLATIDYRFTDPYLDPPGPFAAGCAEAPFCLPTGLWCLDPSPTNGFAGPAVDSVAPLAALANGFVTFGSLNNFFKINGAILEVWAQVLRRAAFALVAKNRAGQSTSAHARLNWRDMGSAASASSFASLRKVLATIWPFIAGSTSDSIPCPITAIATSLDAFWMGVPIATLVGQTMVGRVGFSQLCYLGLAELAATTPARFVEMVAALAGDLPRLQDLRGPARPHAPLPVDGSRRLHAAASKKPIAICGAGGVTQILNSRLLRLRWHPANVIISWQRGELIMTIHLPEELERYLRSEVQSGHFKSEVEAISAAVRLLQHRRQETSGPPQPLTEEEFDQKMIQAGFLGSIPPLPNDMAPTRDFQPTSIQGQPLSETIIHERR